MLLFITIILIEILSGVEVDLFVPSFPELQRTFNLSPFLVQFTLSANMVAYCVCGLFSGALGDRYDRRQVMLFSLFILSVGSICCVIAPNYPVLLIGRVLQGIGMAGPAVLAYPIISDNYPIHKQAAMMGIMGGVTTVAMAFAPVIGSYVNLYFGWRANFEMLLVLSVICWAAGYFVIPNHPGNPAIPLSPKAYWPLLCSTKLMTFMVAIYLMVVPYWIFIGMSPILYMQDLGVPLKEFGYYQGAIAAGFAVTCFASPSILHRLGQKRCLNIGIALVILSTILMALLLLLQCHQPMIITAVMTLMAIGMVFPINILFPLSLTVIAGGKSRATAISLAGRLILTAITLAIVSYFYTGTFLTVGLAMVIFLSLAIVFVWRLFAKKWVNLV